jgi:hypothetical protein
MKATYTKETADYQQARIEALERICANATRFN